MLDVSQVTVRRDLAHLAKSGEVVRTRGGAYAAHHGTDWEPLWDAKYNEQSREKTAIARSAASLVTPGDTLLLDSGSTMARVAEELRGPCKVVTVDLKVAQLLASRSDATIEVSIAGGAIRRGIYSVTGPYAEDVLSQIHVDVTFLAADGVDAEAGITNAAFEEVPVKRRLIAAGRKVILVADSSKVRKVALAAVAPLSTVSTFVVDDGISHEDLVDIQEAGVDVTVVATPQ